jgi:hypothetical protein
MTFGFFGGCSQQAADALANGLVADMQQAAAALSNTTVTVKKGSCSDIKKRTTPVSVASCRCLQLLPASTALFLALHVANRLGLGCLCLLDQALLCMVGSPHSMGILNIACSDTPPCGYQSAQHTLQLN